MQIKANSIKRHKLKGDKDTYKNYNLVNYFSCTNE